MIRVLVIENDSLVEDEIDVVLSTLYSDDDTEVKEINFAKENMLDVMLTSEVYSKLSSKDDEFIVLAMSTFRDLSQLIYILRHFNTLSRPPKLQLVNVNLFIEKVREGRVWGIEKELEDLVEDYIGKGLVENIYVNLDNEVVIEKMT